MSVATNLRRHKVKTNYSIHKIFAAKKVFSGLKLLEVASAVQFLTVCPTSHILLPLRDYLSWIVKFPHWLRMDPYTWILSKMRYALVTLVNVAHNDCKQKIVARLTSNLLAIPVNQ